MQLDTRLPLLAAQQPALQFQPETRLESLGKIAPAINAMRQMQAQQQTQQQEMQRMMQRSAALDEMRRAMQDEDLGKYAQALINSGDETLMQKGAQLQMADLQDRQFRRQFGGITGTPTPDQLSQMALSGQRGIEVTGKLAGRYVPVGQNVLDKFTGQIIAAPPKEVPANALVPGAAPVAVAAGPQPQGRNRYITAGGSLYDTVDKKWLVAPEKTGGGGGAAGAAPRPMTALQQQRLEEQNNARQTLSEELATVLGYYEDLEKQKAMVSTGRTAGENVIAAARATGVGQTAERAIGTQAQTLRDNIANSKFRLIRHIAAITGASSKTMDSNRELQNWLDAMTNVGQSIQTVRETLGRLDQVIASVRSQQEREDAATGRQIAPAPSPAPAAAPAGRPGTAAPAPARTGGTRREIAPGVFVTERP